MFYRSKHFAPVIRFANEGFLSKPYNASNAFHHVLPFLNIEVTDLQTSHQILENDTYIIKPKIDDKHWSGCFAFLNEYNPNLFNGPMQFRKGHKRNIKYINKKQLVWVRNVNYKGEPFFSKYYKTFIHEGKVYTPQEYIYTTRQFNKLCWVKMSLHLALERTQLYKEHFNSDPPEHINEIYLMDDQIRKLVKPYQVFNF
ncbi:hypothetical protein [Bacillus cereus]|uniref:hypothetical protein n=1 Tax=Bacillus cereus TaxID=1396 RepID=UPI00124D35AC|nr:hypothetical protein [Bacillus cereus]KAB2397327.1 hypothetical protein F8171_06580 [Bacillus cereus]